MSGKTSSMRSWKYCSSFGEKYIYIIIYIYNQIYTVCIIIYIYERSAKPQLKNAISGLHYIVLHIKMHIFTYESARIHTSYTESLAWVCVCMLRFKQGVAPDHSGPLPTKTPIWSGDTDWDANLRTCTNFQFHQWQPATPRTGMSIIWRVS